jgi:hypothetical protein
MSIFFVMDWFGFTFGWAFNLCCLFIWFEFQYFFVFSLGLATFGLAFHLVWLPESLFPTVGFVVGARQHCSFLLGGSLSSKSANKEENKSMITDVIQIFIGNMYNI